VEFDPARRVLEALERENVRYAVFGAVALGIHGEGLKRALRSVFDDPSINEISADDLLGDYPAVQYVPPEGAFHLDILTRLGEAFRFSDLEILRAPFEGLSVSVVSPQTLYRMKRGTVRAKDRADAEMLRRRFALGDE
jgi:hypothetical protein